MPDRVAMQRPHYKGEVGPARWYTIVDLETLPVRRDRTYRPVGTWLSLVEHSLGVRGVGSSNLPVPTKNQPSAVSSYCVCCNLAISFWARLASDSDHSTRPLSTPFFSTAAEKATSLAMLARRCFSTNDESFRPSYTKDVSSPKSTSTCPSSL